MGSCASAGARADAHPRAWRPLGAPGPPAVDRREGDRREHGGQRADPTKHLGHLLPCGRTLRSIRTSVDWTESARLSSVKEEPPVGPTLTFGESGGTMRVRVRGKETIGTRL